MTRNQITCSHTSWRGDGARARCRRSLTATGLLSIRVPLATCVGHLTGSRRNSSSRWPAPPYAAGRSRLAIFAIVARLQPVTSCMALQDCPDAHRNTVRWHPGPLSQRPIGGTVSEPEQAWSPLGRHHLGMTGDIEQNPRISLDFPFERLA